MALKRIVELTLNNSRTPGLVLVRSLADFSAYTPQWIEDDKFTVRVRFADAPASVGAVAVPTSLDADNVIVLSARKVRGIGNALFSAQDFEKVVVMDGDTVSDVYYEAHLNLNTAAMLAAYGSDSSATVWVDVEVQAPDPEGGADPDRVTFQFQVLVNRQAYDGDAPVADADPVYPAPGLLALRMPPNANYRIITDGDGNLLLQVKSMGGGEFQTLAPLSGQLASALAGLSTYSAHGTAAAAEQVIVTLPAGSRRHSAHVAVTGPETPRTLILDTANRTVGDTCRVYLILPALVGVIVNLFNNATGDGNLIDTTRSDGSGDTAYTDCVFTEAGWIYDGALYPANGGGGSGGGGGGGSGDTGWTPSLAAVADGERRVLRLVGWLGGTGAEPGFVGYYLGPAGFVFDIADAIDCRGPAGAAGDNGNPGINGTNGIDGNTVLTTIGPPADATGENGDFAYDPNNFIMYGPKAAGAWPGGGGRLLRGPQGLIGLTGNTGAPGEAGPIRLWAGRTSSGLLRGDVGAVADTAIAFTTIQGSSTMPVAGSAPDGRPFILRAWGQIDLGSAVDTGAPTIKFQYYDGAVWRKVFHLVIPRSALAPASPKGFMIEWTGRFQGLGGYARITFYDPDTGAITGSAGSGAVVTENGNPLSGKPLRFTAAWGALASNASILFEGVTVE